MKSSSFHRITADSGSLLYKIFARLLHTPLNFINNLNALKKVDAKLKIDYFRPNNFEEQYAKLNKLSSPSRKLSDLFWINTNWNSLKKELPKINICDLGCGSGNYFFKLQEFSKNKIDSYTGFDIYKYKNWENIQAQHSNVKFNSYNGKELFELIQKKTNLIISQSAIEHFSEDITIFEQIKDFVIHSQQNVYQIHIFPSKATLKLYPFHGIRQYTPRTISKISRLFSDFSEVKLYKLGGEHSNKVHIDFIKKGLLNRDVRKNNEEKYNKACYEAMKKDFEIQNTNAPNFYALVIKTKKQI